MDESKEKNKKMEEFIEKKIAALEVYQQAKVSMMAGWLGILGIPTSVGIFLFQPWGGVATTLVIVGIFATITYKSIMLRVKLNRVYGLKYSQKKPINLSEK